MLALLLIVVEIMILYFTGRGFVNEISMTSNNYETHDFTCLISGTVLQASTVTASLPRVMVDIIY